jgi:hypothetical protein
MRQYIFIKRYKEMGCEKANGTTNIMDSRRRIKNRLKRSTVVFELNVEFLNSQGFAYTNNCHIEHDRQNTSGNYEL